MGVPCSSWRREIDSTHTVHRPPRSNSANRRNTAHSSTNPFLISCLNTTRHLPPSIVQEVFFVNVPVGSIRHINRTQRSQLRSKHPCPLTSPVLPSPVCPRLPLPPPSGAKQSTAQQSIPTFHLPIVSCPPFPCPSPFPPTLLHVHRRGRRRQDTLRRQPACGWQPRIRRLGSYSIVVGDQTRGDMRPIDGT